MKGIRFTIASLLVVVLFAAVGFAALRERSDLWENGVFTLTLASLLTSVLLAIHGSISRRAFWIGFALFGGTYLGLSLVPSIESRLLTTKALAYLDSNVLGRSPGVIIGRLTGSLPSAGPTTQVVNIETALVRNQLVTSSQGVATVWDLGTNKLLDSWSIFVRIGHSLSALLAGCVGGFLSRRLCQAQDIQKLRRRSIREAAPHDRHRSAPSLPCRRLRGHAMRRFRSRIGTVLQIVLLGAGGFAVLSESSDLWDSSILSITLAVLLISILLATHRTRSRRAFWIGFALFGSAYLGLSLVPSIESRLVTTRALAFLNSKMPGSRPAATARTTTQQTSCS